MIENNLKNNFSNLFDAVIYVFQSMSGRRTIPTYLTALSEVTDNIIIESEKNGEMFKNGVCSMEFTSSDVINVSFKLNFENNGKAIVKEASRKVAKKDFTDGALKKLQAANVLNFNIEHP